MNTNRMAMVIKGDLEEAEIGDHDCLFSISIQNIDNTERWPYRPMGHQDNSTRWYGLTKDEVHEIVSEFLFREGPRVRASAKVFNRAGLNDKEYIELLENHIRELKERLV